MPNTEILSLAILTPFEGQESSTLDLLREFYTMMNKKGYSRDLLYRDAKHPSKFVHLRIWKSDEIRSEAQHDPDVHRFWRSMTQVCDVTTAYESLEPVFSTVQKA
jgi:hypothetical protein